MVIKPSNRGRETPISSPHGESAALSYLAHDSQSGGVLTRFYLGMVVPAQTGRQTYTGNCYWSEPNCRYRSVTVEELLAGKLSPTQAFGFVRHSGARFVLGDCRSANRGRARTNRQRGTSLFVRHRVRGPLKTAANYRVGALGML